MTEKIFFVHFLRFFVTFGHKILKETLFFILKNISFECLSRTSKIIRVFFIKKMKPLRNCSPFLLQYLKLNSSTKYLKENIVFLNI